MVQNKEEDLFLSAVSAAAEAQPAAFIAVQPGRKAADGVMSIFRDKLLQEDTACSAAPSPARRGKVLTTNPTFQPSNVKVEGRGSQTPIIHR